MDVEVEKPHVHHPKSGYHWIDLIVPLAALFISFVSIGIAWHHGETMRELVHQNERLVQANSLPHLTFDRTINRSNAGIDQVRLSIANNGVGPAEIQWAQLRVEGQPVDNFSTLLRDCCGSVQARTTASLIGRMLSPQTSLDYFVLQAAPDTRDQVEAFANLGTVGRLEIAVCYCSVFEECWMIKSFGKGRPEKMSNCPAVGGLKE